MAISTPKLGLIAGTLILSSVLSYIILFTSSVPIYSVYEFYEKSDPESMVNTKIQLVGDVSSETSSNFVLKAWETAGNYSILVIHKDVAKPSGFQDGARVLIEGYLKKASSNSYYLEADLISTKCPSKYEDHAQ